MATNDVIGLVQNTDKLRCFTILSQTGRPPGLFVFALPSQTGKPLGLFFTRKGLESGCRRRPDAGAQNMSMRVPPSAKSD